jgi:hypothetical protein
VRDEDVEKCGEEDEETGDAGDNEGCEDVVGGV